MSIWAAIAVLLLWMFQSTNQAVVGTILPYYCKYVFHNDSWMYSTLYLSETIVLIVGILYQLDKKYPAIMKELASAKRAASCNFLIFITLNRFPAWLQCCAGNLYLRFFSPCPHRLGRAFSVCAPCPPRGYSQKVYRCGIAAVRSSVYNKCRAHSCVLPRDY